VEAWLAHPVVRAVPDGPIAIQSATPAHRNLRLVVTKGLFHPWGMAFLPDGGILITERSGCLRIVRNGVLDPKLVAGLPPISAQGLSGLMDIALHPRFAENKFVYLAYHKPNPAAANVPPGPNAPPARLATLARGTWDGTALTNVRELFSADVTTEASRIVFGSDGMI
jgi:glucose/arabinose dehydrogenase